jgi:hypothetical protein
MLVVVALKYPYMNCLRQSELWSQVPLRKSHTFSFNLFPLPAIIFFLQCFVSMHCSETQSTADTCLKCICVYIHPAANSSRSEDCRFDPASGMTSDRDLSNFVNGPCMVKRECKFMRVKKRVFAWELFSTLVPWSKTRVAWELTDYILLGGGGGGGVRLPP